MRRTEWLQETRKMRFEEAYAGWDEGRLTQEEAASVEMRRGRFLWPVIPAAPLRSIFNLDQ